MTFDGESLATQCLHHNILASACCRSHSGRGRRRGTQKNGGSPAAKAEHMTKNIPTAILFREDGSRPCLLSTGSTSLSFSGMSRRMSTASNMVSQAAGSCTEHGISYSTAVPLPPMHDHQDALARDADWQQVCSDLSWRRAESNSTPV